MRKILSALLVFCLLLALGSCASKNGEDNKNQVLSHGTISGNNYKNEYFGISMNKPDGWLYATDEELAEVMNITADTLSELNLEKALENSAVIYDMMAVNPSNHDSVNVIFEDLSKSNSTNITIEKYIEASKKQFEAAGIQSEMGTPEKVNLGKAEFYKVTNTVTLSGTTSHQVMYLKKQDKYMVIMTFSSISGKLSAQEFEAWFE